MSSIESVEARYLQKKILKKVPPVVSAIDPFDVLSLSPPAFDKNWAADFVKALLPYGIQFQQLSLSNSNIVITSLPSAEGFKKWDVVGFWGPVAIIMLSLIVVLMVVSCVAPKPEEEEEAVALAAAAAYGAATAVAANGGGAYGPGAYGAGVYGAGGYAAAVPPVTPYGAAPAQPLQQQGGTMFY